MTITTLEPVTEPLTDDWLREVGFKWSQMERQPSKQWILWLGDCVGCDAEGKREMFSDSQDLGIELAAAWYPNAVGGTGGFVGQWFCWLRADTAGLYHRFVHVRHLRYRHELIALIEGLTGQAWDPANNWYGCMLHPTHAAYRRQEAERLDQKMLRERTPWYPAEKDPTRARAMPDHLNAAIETGKAQ